MKIILSDKNPNFLRMSCNLISCSCSVFLFRYSFCPMSMQITTSGTSTEDELAFNVPKKNPKRRNETTSHAYKINKEPVKSFCWLRQQRNFITNNVHSTQNTLDIIGTLNCLLAWWFMILDAFKSRSQSSRLKDCFHNHHFCCETF